QVVAFDDWGGAGRHSEDGSLIVGSEFLEHVSYLASDELEGRGTGQVGIDKAAEYIAAEFDRLGVEPAGDDNTYFQDLTLRIKQRVGLSTRLAIGTEGRSPQRRLHAKDFVPLPSTSQDSFEGEVAFAGFGITSRSNKYDDYDGLDVKDKVVLVLRRTPDFGDFDRGDAAFSSKSARAAERGAAALMIVNQIGNNDGLYDLSAGRRGRAGRIPVIHVTQALADQMLSAAEMPDLETLQNLINSSRKPASQELDGVSVKGRVSLRRAKTPARNIVGVIPGTGPQKDEYIVVGGHYDHLGIRNKGKSSFDSEKDISNGADDNASGTAGVLAMAKAFTQGSRPNRSILLMLYTAEELGLLGSRHYVRNPTVPLEKCVAMINMDMIGRLNKDRLDVGGMRTGEGFEAMVERLAAKYDLKISDGGGGRGPSDHTHFYRNDIPVLFFFTGIHKQYHKPDDDTHLINTEGAVRVMRLVADCIDEIDARPERPEFSTDRRRAAIVRQDVEDDKDAPRVAARGRAGDAPPAGDRVRLGIVPVQDDENLVVGRVVDGTPAARAGIKARDRIVRIGNKRIRSLKDAREALGGFKPGDSTAIRVMRDGERVRLKVQFGEAEKPAAVAKAPDGRIVESVAGLARQLLALRKLTASDDAGDAPSVWVARGDDSVILTFVFGGISAMHGPASRGERVSSPEDGVSAIADFAAGCDAGFSISTRLTDRVLVIRAQRKDGSSTASGRSQDRFDMAAADATKKKAKRDKKKKKKADVKVAKKAKKKKSNPRADLLDDDAPVSSMPPVRLEIMPSYGMSEGPGYEISGVIEGGAAARAGMKDDDRILKIGSHKIKDIHSYMDALRKYRPGDTVEVTVLRNGKKIKLKITCKGSKPREAA
ncbi:MAG: M20/M25/M40 family metallo-hydrolase, partial [Planctomycetota bacterium]|nr:M20/M25/M40 family metallo-hydrolase [Planctomycetota bacterium]